MSHKKTAKKAVSKAILEEIKPLYFNELKQVDELILGLSESEIEIIPNIIKHIILSGGKRLRPALTILSAKLFNYDGSRHINLAAAIEFLHTATLLHDDVVDGSDLRRGKETANNIFGNKVSILVGDYMLGRAFQLMAQDGKLDEKAKILNVLSDASVIITQGEVAQLTKSHSVSLTKDEYLKIITGKTAVLFAAACVTGAIITKQNENIQKNLYDFGMNLGILFQATDDLLDYFAKNQSLGKKSGDDLKEGKVTLPLILLLENITEEEKPLIDDIIKDFSNEKFAEILKLMEKYEIKEKSMSFIDEYFEKALKSLKNTAENTEINQNVASGLEKLLEFACNRAS